MQRTPLMTKPTDKPVKKVVAKIGVPIPPDAKKIPEGAAHQLAANESGPQFYIHQRQKPVAKGAKPPFKK